MTRSLMELAYMTRLITPKASDPVIYDALRQTAAEFCKYTRCWREVRTLSFVDTELRVALGFTTLVAIEWGRTPGTDYYYTPIAWSDVDKDLVAQRDLNNLRSNGAIAGRVRSTGDTTPSLITQRDTQMIEPFPFNDRTATSEPIEIEFSYWVAPEIVQREMYADQIQQLNVPDTVIEEHGEAIADGAAARIASKNTALLLDPGSAALAMANYNKEKRDAKSRYLKGSIRAPLRTRSQWM